MARAPRTREYIGAADIADALGVTRTAVTQSLRRHGPESKRPFPTPAVRISGVPGWDQSQLAEIREWFRAPASGRPREGARLDALRRAAADVGLDPATAVAQVGEWVRSGAPLDALGDVAADEWPSGLGTEDQVREMASLLRRDLGE